MFWTGAVRVLLENVRNSCKQCIGLGVVVYLVSHRPSGETDLAEYQSIREKKRGRRHMNALSRLEETASRRENCLGTPKKQKYWKKRIYRNEMKARIAKRRKKEALRKLTKKGTKRSEGKILASGKKPLCRERYSSCFNPADALRSIKLETFSGSISWIQPSSICFLIVWGRRALMIRGQCFR